MAKVPRAPPGVLRVGIVPALRSHSVNEGL